MFNADAEVYHFLSKLLKNVQLKKKDKTKKNVLHVHVVQNVKKNVTLNFQKLKLDSQWLTCSETSNFNQSDLITNPLLLKQGIFLFQLVFFDIMVLCYIPKKNQFIK